MAKEVRVNRPYQTLRVLIGVLHKRLYNSLLHCQPLHFRRFDVHQHVGHAGVTSLDRGLYSMRDLVALMYGNVSVHANV